MKLISIGSGCDDCDDRVRAHIVQMFGKETWEKLTARLGGRDFTVPKKVASLDNSHPLVQALGLEGASIFAKHFGGEKIYIAMPSPKSKCLVLAAMNDGLRNVEIAAKLGCTERHVRRVLAAAGIKNPNTLPPRQGRSVAHVDREAALHGRAPVSVGKAGLARVSFQSCDGRQAANENSTRSAMELEQV